MRRIVLLPGLDGTGALFEGFKRTAPDGVTLDVVPLPSKPLSYAELAEYLFPTLQLSPDTILLGDSFSGPLAITLAARQRVRALVLCNTFVAPPRPRALRALAIPLLFHLPPPAGLVRRFLVGPAASDALVALVRAAIWSVPAHVLSARFRAVLTVSVAREFASSAAPVLYLRSTEDRLVPDAALSAVIAAAATKVSVVRLGGPHLLLQTNPTAAWDAIADTILESPAGGH